MTQTNALVATVVLLHAAVDPALTSATQKPIAIKCVEERSEERRVGKEC